MSDLTIGQLAKLIGVSVHQVRYWERHNLLVPRRSRQSGYRQYGLESVYRVAQIKYLRDLGVPTALIGPPSQGKPNRLRRLLEDSLVRTDSEIQRLQALAAAARRVLAIDLDEMGRWITATYPALNLRSCGQFVHPSVDVQALTQLHLPPQDFVNGNLVFVVTSSISLYISCAENYDKSLPAGVYRCFRFAASDDAGILSGIASAFDQAQSPSQDSFTVVELALESLLLPGSMIYEVRVLVTTC